ncbi:glycoside hydrolase family 2 protein [Vibrio comitans]|uniref:Beta-galactosidase n=1 Tax=Vibrio comitans NBRC 102076 TaxID=1219078 RepID=A0A4Y3INU9_9VIBR|nr:glycoside hydrolase family 2 TIM barrel-domain containing protein [Vibrio comitans]GEA61179.1 beta-galactosidase [Vibrio comitans NBRC 102076]
MSQRINLNSNWLFIKQPFEYETLQITDPQQFDQINLPHTWNAIDGTNGGDNYHRGLCWYKKTIQIESIEDTKHYFIEIGAANSVANVYLNGVHLGEHQGGYSLFRFDVTDSLIEGANELFISVDNSHYEDVYPLFADFTFYGGLYRDVNLVIAEDIHFDLTDMGSSGVYVSQRSVTNRKASIEVKALVTNNTQNTPVLEVEFVDRQDQVVAHGKTLVENHISTIDLVIDDPILWQSVENPYLYECRVRLSIGGVLKDSLNIQTGLRYFEFNGKDGFVLNGKPTKIRGVSRHQDREAIGNALTKEHQIQDMQLIKEVGANSIRLAHYQHSDFFYELSDQAGMIIWAEPPHISKTSDTDLQGKNATNQMRELIRQTYNHSSIVLWGVQNEIGMMPNERPLLDTVTRMHDVVKQEDTTRLTTQAQIMMIREDDPANFATDTVAFNQYHGWYIGETSGYEQFIQDFRKANPNGCLGYSEYGAEGIIDWHSDDPKVKDYTEEYHAKYHEEVLAIFDRYDYVWGSYVWNFFDFGSDMRNEGGVAGRNNKGLLTFDRAIKKDAFYFYKSVWSNEPVVHITSKRFKERHLDNIKVKVYSNLEGLTLTNNGQKIPLLKREGTGNQTIHWFDVALSAGYNRVEAQAQGIIDVVEFRKVAQPNQDYILPKDKTGGILDDMFNFDNDDNIKNWFSDSIEEAKLPELEYPEGRLSIRNKISEIMTHPEGKVLMEELFKPLLEHEKAQMAFGMPFEFIVSLQPDRFPNKLVHHFNRRLNELSIIEVA